MLPVDSSKRYLVVWWSLALSPTHPTETFTWESPLHPQHQGEHYNHTGFKEPMSSEGDFMPFALYFHGALDKGVGCHRRVLPPNFPIQAPLEHSPRWGFGQRHRGGGHELEGLLGRRQGRCHFHKEKCSDIRLHRAEASKSSTTLNRSSSRGRILNQSCQIFFQKTSAYVVPFFPCDLDILFL